LKLLYRKIILQESRNAWMRFLPIFLDLASGVVVLVGSGEPALSKLRLLDAAGACMRWYPLAQARTIAAEQGDRIAIATGDPTSDDWSDAIAVVAAAGSPLDEDIAARAKALRIAVNVVDRPDLSTFIVPAIVDRGDVVVAIGTGGAAPVLARRLRERIEALLPQRIGRLATLMGRYRARLNAALPALSDRRRFWERVIDGPIGSAVLSGQPEGEALLVDAIDNGAHAHGTGTVFLVGAGPGDPDLLTLRALHTLQDADIVFYDELVTEGVLDRARRDAERVFVGKRGGQPGIGQDEINRRLVDAARVSKRVVRLKGGDPFVFGRGGEELEHLRATGVAVVIVPGITAALGCAAEAGLPLTFRNEASRLAIITAHRADDAAAIDWSSLADPQTTLVVYMGLASAAAVRDGLIAAGRAADTPAAVLARGSRPDSQAAVGRLDTLPDLATSVGEGPALLVIGEVVARSTPWRDAEVEALTRLAA
jgi:uroporphyrin-III C-methyltransferase / precorrin-2 dehydrogenase / sirohydrochlorin ferrochelatase